MSEMSNLTLKGSSDREMNQDCLSYLLTSHGMVANTIGATSYIRHKYINLKDQATNLKSLVDQRSKLIH